jgi:hypothetical protein
MWWWECRYIDGSFTTNEAHYMHDIYDDENKDI